MGQVFVLSLTSALNPTLIAATTLMMLLSNAKKLMFGYLLGALVTSITLGLVIVFALEGSGAVSTTKKTLNPAVDIALGALGLIVAIVLRTQRDKRVLERRRARKGPKQDKKPPRWQQILSQGSARSSFVAGAVLTLPGASYLAGLDRLGKQDASTIITVLVVIAFNLIMLLLLEIPLLGYVVSPQETPRRVEQAKAWVAGHGRRLAVIGSATVGGLLILKGIIGLLH